MLETEAAQFARGLDSLNGLSSGVQAHALGFAWRVAAAYSPALLGQNSELLRYFRDKWTTFEGLVRPSYSDYGPDYEDGSDRDGHSKNELIRKGVREFANGVGVLDKELAGAFYLERISIRIPQILGGELDPLLFGEVDYRVWTGEDVDWTKGAQVLAVAFLNLSGLDLQSQGREFGKRIINANDELLGPPRYTVCPEHVVTAVSAILISDKSLGSLAATHT